MPNWENTDSFRVNNTNVSVLFGLLYDIIFNWTLFKSHKNYENDNSYLLFYFNFVNMVII